MSGNISPKSALQVTALFAATALAYGGEAGQQFAATPSVAQTLNDKIVEDGSWFLQKVHVVPVKEIKGEKIVLGLSGNVTGRTDTSGAGVRTAKNLADTNASGYELFKTESDVALGYATIDAWAKFKDFVERYGKQVRKAIGNDRIKIGWNGTSVAATTVAADLSDVNIGWLQLIRAYNGGSQYVLGAAGSVTLGGATFPNLDSLVYDAKTTIADEFQEDPDLVVLIGRNVMQYAKGAYYEAVGDTPTEKAAMKEKKSVDTYGGLNAYMPPFFPADSILITSFENLAIYYQEDSWRRKQQDKPEKDQYEDFNSRNEGYVIGEEGKTSFVEGIEYA